MPYIYDMAAVWNNGATVFNAIKMDVTDTASDAASLLMDLLVGGASKFKVDKAGSVTLGGGLTVEASSLLRMGGATASYPAFKRSSTTIQARLADDSALAAFAARSIALGLVADAVPVAATQSLSAANAQSVLDLATTWNTSGTPAGIKLNVTDTASNAASLLLDLQTGGTSRFKVAKNGAVTLGGSNTNTNFFKLSAGGGGSAANADFIVQDVGGTQRFEITHTGNEFAIAGANAGSNGFRVKGQSTKLVLTTDGSNIIEFAPGSNAIEHRNGANAQTYNQYFSYTDASNYTRMAFKTATGVHTIETESAGTGEANIDLALTPKGTGRVRFGTHSAIAAETVTGYITIKDAGGTSRKIAVVS